MCQDQPRVTHLMMNGNDVSEVNEIYEGRMYNISCIFDEGNPAANFSLVNGRGDELNVTRSSRHINHVFIAERSKHELFIVYCRARGSERNMSTMFLMQGMHVLRKRVGACDISLQSYVLLLINV